jgi:hypothetical protein
LDDGALMSCLPCLSLEPKVCFYSESTVAFSDRNPHRKTEMTQITTPDRPIVALIKKHQERLALSDEGITKALGYERANVIQMIKTGKMIFPISKVIPLAEIFEIDPIDAFRAALGEMPEFLAVIEQLYPLSALTATEQNLILHLRKISGDKESRPLVFDGQAIIALVTAG